MAQPSQMPSARRHARFAGALEPTFRWGVYTRISDDREGEEKGVARQEQDGHAKVVSRGGHVQEVYEENDTSAYKKKRVKLNDDGYEFTAYRVVRPVFKRALSDLREGRLDGLIVYDLDRLARDMRDLEDCIEVVEHFGRVVESAQASKIDLTTSDGRTMARVLVAMANKNSADTARRVERAHIAAAQAGEPMGGRRPFGWNDDKRTLNPVEAQMIRDAAVRLLAGEKLHTIAVEWSESGISTPRGKVWRRSTLVEIFTNPRLCGMRAYHGEIMIGLDGEEVVGKWTPLISREEWERLNEMFSPTPSQSPPGGRGRRYLFSGFLRCGKPTENGLCGHRLGGYPHPKSRPGDGFTYGCASRADGGCGGLTVSGAHVDEVLTGLVLTALERRQEESRAVQGTPGAWPRDQELVEAQLVLRNLGDAMRGGMPASEYLRLADAQNAVIKELQADRSRYLSEESLMDGGDGTWKDRWERMTLEEKRATVTRAKLEMVLVHPSRNRGTRHFDPTRLEAVWG